MKIRSATELDQAAWDNYVINHKDGLAYHQYAWKKAIAEAYHFDDRYLVAEQDGCICGVLPLINFKTPLVAGCFLSLPYCDQAGCLAEEPRIETALINKALALARKENINRIELRKGEQWKETINPVAGQRKVRMVLELPESSGLLLKGMKSKLRSQVCKPMREGLTSKLGGIEMVADFYHIFTQNMRALGSPVHSRQWIESIVNHYADNARVGLILTPDGQPAAAGIILLHGRTVSIPWASSLRKFNKMNANMMLYWTFLAFSANRGFARFDFGRSTIGEGTYKFKQQWGAKPVGISWESIDPEGRQKETVVPPSDLRQKAENLWARMPLGLCNTVGPLVRRHISL